MWTDRLQDELVSEQARKVAETISSQVLAEQLVYAEKVVQKLEQDGTGAAPDAQLKLGFVHLPEQFMREVGSRATSSFLRGTPYQYRLLSEWNHSPETGIIDAFEKWAWGRLKEQENAFRSNGTVPDHRLGYPWQPVYRLEKSDTGKVLRFMSAVPANAACLNCHNTLAQSTTGRQWQSHELLGALAISVPMRELDRLAARARIFLLAGIGGIFLLVAVIVTLIVSRAGIGPIMTTVNLLREHATQLEQAAGSLVNVNRDIAFESEQQFQALRKLDFIKDLYGHDRQLQGMLESAANSLDKTRHSAEQVAAALERSTMVCSKIEKSCLEIKKICDQTQGKTGQKKSTGK
ncbi:MAG: DUF3365 domain-containing protein [candidate division KSB1 bacterium]|nr:DUF3365 domain-containing protein [candidate division KSB1 bacterium]MDZ7287556.1 DUF3365 domain-containing protein [candidate division KSB1 bacterium]MDZ7308040.1 DUF3365 domain-containing protein [candidate division KSB1 bacterium]MDZ7350534.1 DUF3365 domain-containing protein [candidate division KSB1 bacterium]MDZ7354906.1 DUF3365 domain-containing protein [candidate division KSB1 bacterium]